MPASYQLPAVNPKSKRSRHHLKWHIALFVPFSKRLLSQVQLWSHRGRSHSCKWMEIQNFVVIVREDRQMENLAGNFSAIMNLTLYISKRKRMLECWKLWHIKSLLWIAVSWLRDTWGSGITDGKFNQALWCAFAADIREAGKSAHNLWQWLPTVLRNPNKGKEGIITQKFSDILCSKEDNLLLLLSLV